MNTSIARDLLVALNIVTFQKQNHDQFKIIGNIPNWLKQLHPNIFVDQANIDLGSLFPFLDNFLVDAEQFWHQNKPGLLKSGLWTEVDNFGKEYHLESSALSLGSKKILIVISSKKDYLEKYFFLQKARTKSLDYIIERKQTSKTLVKSTFYDSLTGLPNQTFFNIELMHAFERCKQEEFYHFAILLLNLDRFKVVNASLGQFAGDQVLMSVAMRIKQCLNAKDVLARLCGDEFAILLDKIVEVDQVLLTANQILTQIKFPFNANGIEVFITGSVGITFSMMDYESGQDLLRDANTAMHHAKELGSARCMIFNPAMRTQKIKILQLENDLHRAISNKELQLVYQPIVCLHQARIIGFEALLRWLHPERGLILPIDFLAIAEETDLIISIDQWTIRETCFQIQQWCNCYNQPFSIHVNLSAKGLDQPDFFDQIKQVLRETGIKPENLTLEIRENTLISHSESALNTLYELKGVGVHLCIDDFCSGHASLSYLQKLPVDILKMERSFIKTLPKEGVDIVNGIITLTHNLGITVIANGVDRSDQVSQLLRLNCDYAQGSLFSEPVDNRSAIDVINSQDIRRRCQISASE